MKKFFVVCFLTVFLIAPVSAMANIVYFGIDNTIDFSLLEGFDLYVNQPEGPPADLSATFYYQADTDINVFGDLYSGAIPNNLGIGFPWDTDLATYGAFGFNVGGATLYPLQEGLVCALSSSNLIAITEISLTGFTGAFPNEFFVHERTSGDDIHYTVSSMAVVPIPSALLLFAGGLLGMVGIRRKLKK